MKTYILKIVQDTDAHNPRKEFDHAGMVVTWLRDYDLSDKEASSYWRACEGFEEWYRGEPFQKRESAGALAFALSFAYRAEGVSMSQTPGIEDGAEGYIYIERENILKEWGTERDKERAAQGKRLRKGLYKQAEACLRAEIEELNSYLTGDVYGYIIEDEDGEHVDSCWSFYGREYCEEQGKEQLKYYEEEAKKDAEREVFADYRAGGA